MPSMASFYTNAKFVENCSRPIALTLRAAVRSVERLSRAAPLVIWRASNAWLKMKRRDHWSATFVL
jgi:hypothetical protein